MTEYSGTLLVSQSSTRTTGSTESRIGSLLQTTVPLSFWGGIDPRTGIIVDATHPLYGSCVSGTIFCLPSGRGSCTASQVLLELILNNIAPAAIVLRDLDGLVCLGAIVAQELFDHNQHHKSVPDIVHLGTHNYNQLFQNTDNRNFAKVTPSGNLILGSSHEDIAKRSNLEAKPTKSLSDPDILTEEEQAMLDAADSKAEEMALWVLFRYARIVTHPNPPLYIDIEASHIDGCTYIGPGGLELAQRFKKAGGKVKVPTTLNSVSCDRKQWKHLGVPDNYARPSLALGDAYLALGCQPTFTCAPYLLLPEKSLLGKDVCWGESNAVVYANSVLGARTEKYADYLDICAALVGKTVKTGVHVDENRIPQIILDATDLLQEIASKQLHSELDSLFPVLGHLCGTLSDGLVPLLLGLESWKVNKDQLKAFCAAFGTTGTSPLIHIAGITPEVLDQAVVQHYVATVERPPVTITADDMHDTYATLDSSNDSECIDLVALGNPHLSVSECKVLSELVKGLIKHDSVRVMACMSRSLKTEAQEHVTRLENFGVEFIHDTCWCMLLDPPVIPLHQESTILTNSGKYAHYGPGLTKRKYRFGSWQDCVSAAVSGTITRARHPPWLSQRSIATATMAAFRRAVR